MPESRSRDDKAPIMTGIEINGPTVPGLADILTDEACAFVAKLERQFGDERRRLLEARVAFQARIDAGENPAFRPDTEAIREGDWTIAGTPADLADRRVEITGPVDRKMIINALNCGASCFMADFEDAASPTWEAMIAGQVNLRDAARRTIALTDPNSGKSYALGDETATLHRPPRAAGILRKAHLPRRRPPGLPRACSTSGSTSSTTRRSSVPTARAPTSTCPSWSTTKRRRSGTPRSSWHRRSLAFPSVPLRPRC